MDNHALCRALLHEVMKDVHEHTTAEQRKGAWGYRYQYGDDIEFHGPNNFYWNGSGCCVWIARADGWSAWLKSKGIE